MGAGALQISRHDLSLELSEAVAQTLRGKTAFSVLEAGCGSLTNLQLPNGGRITGIDISQKQLARNAALDETILGDLQTFRLPTDQYDCCVCWDVLEHLNDPVSALRNLVQATKPGGVMVIAIPNRNSLKGLITLMTPHSFHVWVYRNIYNRKDAGTDDRGPFKTFLKEAISAKALKKFAKSHGLTEERFVLYTSTLISSGYARAPVLFSFYGFLVNALKLCSLGFYDGNLTDIALVWRKGQP